jgi:hypothetical protein|nr:MAG TPA: hypothetical protein [Caudoviricetes sp.]
MRSSYEEFYDINERVGQENVVWDVISGVFKAEPIAATITVIGFTLAAGIKASDWYQKHKLEKAKKNHEASTKKNVDGLIKYAEYIVRDEVTECMDACNTLASQVASKALADAEKYYTVLPFLFKLNNRKIKLDPSVISRKNEVLNKYDDLETGKDPRGFAWFDVMMSYDTDYDISNIEIRLTEMKDGSYGIIIKGKSKTATFTSKETYTKDLGFFGEAIDKVLKDLQKSTDVDDADAMVQWLEGKIYDWAYEDFEVLQSLFAKELYRRLDILRDDDMAYKIIRTIPSYPINYVPVLYKVKK